MYEHESFFNSDYEEQTYQAERELNGFIKAVRELFGPELARTATEDWLEESELTSARLASRLDATQNRQRSVAA